MRHLKRLNAPNAWKIPRKKTKYIAKPIPGPHKKDEYLPLIVLLRDILNLVKTTREANKILSEGKILIDKKIRKDHKFPVGLMDILEIPSINQHYIILFDKNGKLCLHKISKDASKSKISKIINKRMLRGKKLQLNLYDGRNLLVDKDAYKVGDSVVLEDNKIVKHLRLDKGSLIYLTGGRHVGSTGVVEDIKKFKGTQEDRVIFKSHEKEKFETLKRYAFVIEKPFEKWARWKRY